MDVSVQALFRVCFFETAYYGLVRLFRSPRFPLWSSVEGRVLEIVGLDPGLGLTIADSYRF